MTSATLMREIDRILTQTIEIRRHVHKHPELSCEELQTTAYICDILEKGKDAITDSTLLLIQPMIAPAEVRSYLYSNGFDILNEYVVREEDKFYNIMAVKKGSCVLTDELLYIGKNLSSNSPDVIDSYLDYKIRVCEKIINGHKMSKNPDDLEIEKYSRELSIYQKTKKELML